MDKYTDKCTERCYVDFPIHPVKRSWVIWTHKVVYKIYIITLNISYAERKIFGEIFLE